jgi:hypothetical protein
MHIVESNWSREHTHSVPPSRRLYTYATSHYGLFLTLLPSIAVLALYFIDGMSARLGAILGFSAMFALVLALFTNARSIEIFTATASCVVSLQIPKLTLTHLSFAAVQVVFVGGTNSGHYQQQICNVPLQGTTSHRSLALM